MLIPVIVVTTTKKALIYKKKTYSTNTCFFFFINVLFHSHSDTNTCTISFYKLLFFLCHFHWRFCFSFTFTQINFNEFTSACLTQVGVPPFTKPFTSCCYLLTFKLLQNAVNFIFCFFYKDLSQCIFTTLVRLFMAAGFGSDFY